MKNILLKKQKLHVGGSVLKFWITERAFNSLFGFAWQSERLKVRMLALQCFGWTGCEALISCELWEHGAGHSFPPFSTTIPATCHRSTCSTTCHHRLQKFIEMFWGWRGFSAAVSEWGISAWKIRLLETL